MVEYTLIRSRRKTIAIHIKDGEIEVRAPIGVKKRDIDNFIISKKHLIDERLALSKESAEKREVFVLNFGDSVIYRGAKYPILAREGMLGGFDKEVFYLPPDLDSDEIKHNIVRLYRLLAEHYIAERVEYYSTLMGVSFTAVKINGAKTRWGSCSDKKSLNFSWRLIMAEDAVIDYVVVHELSHINEMNHSKRFWETVEKMFPDYAEQQEKLKELQNKLNTEDWE